MHGLPILREAGGMVASVCSPPAHWALINGKMDAVAAASSCRALCLKANGQQGRRLSASDSRTCAQPVAGWCGPGSSHCLYIELHEHALRVMGLQGCLPTSHQHAPASRSHHPIPAHDVMVVPLASVSGSVRLARQAALPDTASGLETGLCASKKLLRLVCLRAGGSTTRP